MKYCSKCKTEKSKEEFRLSKSTKDGFYAWCIKCSKEYDKKNKEKNKEKIIQYRLDNRELSKKYREENSERIKSNLKEWYIKNKEKHKQNQRDRYNLNPENSKNYSKNYRIKNLEWFKDYNKNYYEEKKETIKSNVNSYRLKNLDSIKIKKSEYSKNNKDKINLKIKLRKNTDENFKIKCLTHNLFNQSFSKALVKKNKCIFKYTGIMHNDYVEHFKNNFPVEFSEITIKNKYHIDHIIPCAVYDFLNLDDIKKCWQPENLRLLDAKENLKKKDKLDINLIMQYGISHLLPEKLRRLS